MYRATSLVMQTGRRHSGNIRHCAGPPHAESLGGMQSGRRKQLKTWRGIAP